MLRAWFIVVLSTVLMATLSVVSLSSCSPPAANSTQTSTAATNLPAIPGLTSIEILPGSPVTIYVNIPLQFRAVGTKADGSSIDLSTGVEWASSDNNIVKFYFQSTAIGVASGTAYITASLSGITSQKVSITVLTP